MSDTGKKILDYAQKLIVQRGFNAFSYKDLADKIGIKTSSIHYYFPTKEDLSLAVAERFVKDFSDELNKLDSSISSPLRRIEHYGKLFLSALDDGEGFCLCASLATDRVSLSDDTKEVVKNFFRSSQDWVKKTIKAGQEKGEISEQLNAAKTAVSIVSLFEGALVLARAHQEEKPVKEAISWAKEILKS